MRHYGGDIELAINELNAELDIVFVVLANHHASLVEADFIIATYFYLRLKLTSVCGIEKGAVIDRETIMCNTPIISLCRHIHLKRTLMNRVGFGLVEPLHFLKRLSLRIRTKCCY